MWNRVSRKGFPGQKKLWSTKIVHAFWKYIKGYFSLFFDDSHIKEGKIKITQHNEIAFLTTRILKINIYGPSIYNDVVHISSYKTICEK